MHATIGFLLLAVVIGNPGVLFSQQSWTVELHAGIEKSARMPLTIYQEGFPVIRIDKADYESRALKFPLYYDLRISKWWNREAVQLEVIHHKFFLKNTTTEVEHFEMTHGFNAITINYGRLLNQFVVNAGAGSVLLHAENTVRDLSLPSSTGFDAKRYRLTGLILQSGIGRRLNLNQKLFVNVEFKTAWGFVHAPIVLGYARANVLIFQLVVGPGYKFGAKE